MVVTSQTAPCQVTVTVGYPGAQYYQNPYPCQLLVYTSQGVRLISLGPLPPLTAQDIQQMENVVALQVGSCERLVDPWFNQFHQYNPVWSVDPPPGSQIEKSWGVVVNGLLTGQTASLVNTQTGQTLMTATAQSGVATRLTAVTGPNEAISIVRGGSEAAASRLAVHSDTMRGIGVTEQLLVHCADVSLGQKAQRIGTAYLKSRPITYAVMADRVAAYDVSVPTLPRLFATWVVPGVRGAIPWQGGLLAFGADGFATLAADGGVGAKHVCHGVLDAVPAGNGIIAARRESLDVYSRTLCLHSSAQARATRLARLGPTLVAAERSRLSVFDAQDPFALHRKEAHLDLDAVDLVSVPDSGGRSLAAVTSLGAAVVTFPKTGEPHVVATFAAAPWFLGLARLPGLVARLSGDLSAIRLSAPGASKTI
jgi:hypothetical protein